MPHHADFFPSNHEYLSNLPLQMILYFHSFASLAYAATILPVLLVAPPDGDESELVRIMGLILLFLWLLTEPLRLYLGWVGNIRELVPNLVGFFGLTVFPVFPLMVFFAVGRLNTPYTFIMSVVQLFFLVPELLLGFLVARRILASQSARFYRAPGINELLSASKTAKTRGKVRRKQAKKARAQNAGSAAAHQAEL